MSPIRSRASFLFLLCWYVSIVLAECGCAVQLTPKPHNSPTAPATACSNTLSTGNAASLASYPSTFAIWLSALTAVVVAAIGGIAAFKTATRVADKNADYQARIAAASVSNANQIEADKREYTARGHRRKLTFLLVSTANAIKDALDRPGQVSKQLKAAETALSEFTRLLETPSAFDDESQVNAIYDLVLALERASLEVADFRVATNEKYRDAANEGKFDPEEEWWDDEATLEVLSTYLVPFALIAQYFGQYRSAQYSDNVISQEANLRAKISDTRSIVDANELQRSFRKAKREREAAIEDARKETF